jgi:DNA methylase
VATWVGRSQQLDLDAFTAPKVTHQLFRYPAKFHPPVVASLLERYTREGDLVLDPFVGSGTALVEAMVRGRRSIGTDIDSVAATVALAKTRHYDLEEVDKAVSILMSSLSEWERPVSEYQRLMFVDVPLKKYKAVVKKEELWIPGIPHLHHWFRRYVLIDLSRILRAIEEISAGPSVRLLLRLVFASIIRNSSNADPVPVSGLEYTIHMKRRDEAGRQINPYGLFRMAMRKAQVAINEYVSLTPKNLREPIICIADALSLPIGSNTIGAVITSPPYHNAVDYYRRHLLEMYWLGNVATHEDRLLLLPRYIGRPRVPAKNPLLSLPWNPPSLTANWEERIRVISGSRANDFRHYVQAMTMSFRELARVMQSGAPALMVVGHSTWNGQEIPTVELFAELASPLALDEVLHYPVKNRYMSYSRRNNASIDREYVLVFRKA